MNPKISIIVPVYKVEKYLNKCIDSILSQTFTDFELILVDDGSPDQCGEICDEYAKQDKRIVVIHKENGGLSSARNTGLDRARGEYIGFVDSDDYIEKDMYLEMYNACVKNGTDGAIIGTREINIDEKIIYEYIPQRISLNDVLERAHVCNKLYKKDCLKEERFEVNRYYEDVGLTPKLYIMIKSWSMVSKVGYVYRQTPNSITHKKDKKILDLLWAYGSVKNFLIEKELYDYYQDEFNVGIIYLKNFYKEKLYTYPLKFIIKNYKAIYLGFKPLTKIEIHEYVEFVLKYIKLSFSKDVRNRRK